MFEQNILPHSMLISNKYLLRDSWEWLAIQSVLRASVPSSRSIAQPVRLFEYSAQFGFAVIQHVVVLLHQLGIQRHIAVHAIAELMQVAAVPAEGRLNEVVQFA